jgi:hypothetical protein
MMDLPVFGAVAIGVVLGIGLFMAIFWPYRAFLFGLFISLASSTVTMAQTRTEELGAYFQLGDACLIIMILACLRERKKGLLLPAPAVVLLAVLTMGFLNSWFHLGLTYGVLRAYRWAIVFPLMIFLTANMVQEAGKVKSLLLVLVTAAIAAEAQHLLLVVHGTRLGEDIGLLRNIAFARAGSDVWLLGGPYITAGSILHPWVQMAIGVLFLVANITHQTRSVALGFMGGMVGYYLWFLKGPNAFRWQRFKGLLKIMVIGLLLMAIVGLFTFVVHYQERLTYTVTKGEGTESRLRGLRIGLNDWLNGNPLIGRGLYYFQTHFKEAKFRKGGVSWGDLGYLAYLTQLGLIGLLAYGVWLPLIVLRRARRLILKPEASPEIIHLAALTGACFIYLPVMHIFSSSFLIIQYLPGVLVGGVWGVVAFQMEESKQPAREIFAREAARSPLVNRSIGTGKL